jgi:hypothetical protein
MTLRGYGPLFVLAGAAVWPLIFFAVSRYHFMPRGLSTARTLLLMSFLVFAGLSGFASPIPWQSLGQLGMVAVVLLIVLQFNTNLTSRGYESGLKIYCALGLAILVWFAIYDYKPDTRLGTGRDIMNPNAIALVAVSIAVAAMAYRTWYLRYSFIITSAAVLFMTGSRASALSMLIAISLTALVRQRQMKRHTILAVAGLGTLAVSGLLLSGDFLVERFEKYLALGSEYRGITSGVSGRTIAWDATWEMFLQNPVLGVGFRAHEHMLGVATSSHNGYLAMLAEIGIFGFSCTLVLILMGLVVLWQRTRRDELLWSQSILFGLAVGYMVAGIFERFLINIGNPTSLLFLLSVLLPPGIDGKTAATSRPVAPVSRGTASPLKRILSTRISGN